MSNELKVGELLKPKYWPWKPFMLIEVKEEDGLCKCLGADGKIREFDIEFIKEIWDGYYYE